MNLLQLCAFLFPDHIPEKILTAKGGVCTDSFQFNQAIEVARAYSLLHRDPRTKALSMHRLVQAMIKASLSRKEYWELAERTINLVAQLTQVSGWLQNPPGSSVYMPAYIYEQELDDSEYQREKDWIEFSGSPRNGFQRLKERYYFELITFRGFLANDHPHLVQLMEGYDRLRGFD